MVHAVAVAFFPVTIFNNMSPERERKLFYEWRQRILRPVFRREPVVRSGVEYQQERFWWARWKDRWVKGSITAVAERISHILGGGVDRGPPDVR